MATLVQEVSGKIVYNLSDYSGFWLQFVNNPNVQSEGNEWDFHKINQSRSIIHQSKAFDLTNSKSMMEFSKKLWFKRSAFKISTFCQLLKKKYGHIVCAWNSAAINVFVSRLLHILALSWKFRDQSKFGHCYNSGSFPY